MTHDPIRRHLDTRPAGASTVSAVDVLYVQKFYSGVLATTLSLSSAVRSQERYGRELNPEQLQLLRNIKAGESLKFGNLEYRACAGGAK